MASQDTRKTKPFFLPNSAPEGLAQSLGSHKTHPKVPKSTHKTRVIPLLNGNQHAEILKDLPCSQSTRCFWMTQLYFGIPAPILLLRATPKGTCRSAGSVNKFLETQKTHEVLDFTEGNIPQVLPILFNLTEDGSTFDRDCLLLGAQPLRCTPQKLGTLAEQQGSCCEMKAFINFLPTALSNGTDYSKLFTQDYQNSLNPHLLLGNRYFSSKLV
ncbi:unnamed protein product [Prunus armeniaca]